MHDTIAKLIEKEGLLFKQCPPRNRIVVLF